MTTELDDFLTVAVSQRLLTADRAAEVAGWAAERGTPTVQAALVAGHVSSIHADIVETLRKPLDLVPGYEVLEHLGHGGMGVVFRARQLAFDRMVALKTVLVGVGTSPTGLARFEQEARTIGRLIHPHLVTAYDFGRHSGRLYLAMEFLKGEDGEQFVHRMGPCSEATGWGLIRQAAAGLAYAAEAGVIHRDIKPANLLLVPAPAGFSLPPGLPLVKVADFGLALLQDETDERTRLTRDNTTVGSPHYMAPEQLSGSRVDHRADLYALGATAYHFFAGVPPFHGSNLSQLYAQKLQGEPTALATLRPDLSPASIALIHDLLQRDPEQRVADYNRLLDRLAPLTGDRPSGAVTMTLTQSPTATVEVPQAASPGPAITQTPPRRRGRWLVAGLAAALLAGLVWAGAAYFAPAPLPAVRSWKPTGYAMQAFDGKSLKGWRTISGSWIPGTDDGDGGLVLAGAGGALAYPLVKDRKPLLGYQVLAVVSVHQAAAAEMQFGFDANSSACHVLRLLPDRVQLGERSAEHGALSRTVADRPLPGDPTKFHELRVERHEHHWWAFVDDELLGRCPIPPTPVRFEFRIAAERDPQQVDSAALFGDIIVEELAPLTTPQP